MSARSFILICLFISLGIAQGQVNWAGTWDLRATPSAQACFPDTSILISQTAGHITASWTWETTEICTTAGLAGKPFSQTVENTKTKSIALTDISSTLTIDEDDDGQVTFVINNGASATYYRRRQYVYWEGTWDIETQEDSACNPDKFISIVNSEEYHYFVTVSWTWADTPACAQYGLAGVNFTDLAKASMENTLTLSSISGENSNLVAIFAANRDEGVFSSVNGTTSTFIRRQEAVSFTGTWNMTGFDSNSCYPNSTVNITQSAGNVIVSWRWQNSQTCQFLGLAETNFSQTQPTPKGKALFIDLTAKDLPRTTGLFVVNGEKAQFVGSDGGSADFALVHDHVDPKPKSHLGWIIGGVVLVVVLVVGGFYLIQQKKKKEIENGYRSADASLMA